MKSAKSNGRASSRKMSQRGVMPTNVFSMYRRYIAMDGKRSLSILAEESASPSLPTLKRWSIRYGWAALASVHDDLMTQRLMAELTSSKPLSALDLIAAGKNSFYDRAALSAKHNRELSPKERRRILNPSVLDFCRLLRLEREFREDLKSSK